MLKEVLTSAGYNIYEASTGKDALTLYSKLKPDLTLLDINMPDMSGLDIALQFKKTRRLPFIILSGQGDHDIVQRAVDLGAITYLLKPLGFKEIITAAKIALMRGVEIIALRNSEQHLNNELTNNRTSNVAVGILMERFRLSSGESYNLLRNYARFQCRNISAVARDLVKDHENINIPFKMIKGSSE